MASPGKWLWKASMGENFFDASHRHGTLLVTYTLTLATPAPLAPPALHAALTHWFRKVPNLRVRYDDRDGERWMREMGHQTLDFQVVEGGSVEETLTELRSYRYDSHQGPLWCARLRPAAAAPTAGEPMPGFPHVSTLHLGFHHAITDGTSTVKMCGLLVKILDDVLAGRTIDDNVQLGDYVSPEKTDRLVDEKVKAMKTDPEVKAKVFREAEAIKGKVSLSKSNHKAEQADGVTKFIIRTLDQETTSSFIKACRANGITVNSAFTTLAALALVDVAADGGLHQDTYDVTTNHVVSARRYWEGDTSSILGLHIIPPMPIVVATPRNICESFWELAKTVHRQILDGINAEAPIFGEATKRFFIPENPNYDDLFKAPSKQKPSDNADVCFSNMGDVTKTLGEGGEYVQLIHMFRSTSIHRLLNNWSHLFHTFRGRLINVLDYNTTLVNTHMAQMFLDQIYHYLHKVI